MDRNKTTLVLLIVGGIFTLFIIVAGIKSQYQTIVSDPDDVSQTEEAPLSPGPRR